MAAAEFSSVCMWVLSEHLAPYFLFGTTAGSEVLLQCVCVSVCNIFRPTWHTRTLAFRLHCVHLSSWVSMRARVCVNVCVPIQARGSSLCDSSKSVC